MTDKESPIPAESKKAVKEIDWALVLSSEDLASLAGFFDVLIEMDFEQMQRNKKGDGDEVTTQDNIKSKS